MVHQLRIRTNRVVGRSGIGVGRRRHGGLRRGRRLYRSRRRKRRRSRCRLRCNRRLRSGRPGVQVGIDQHASDEQNRNSTNGGKHPCLLRLVLALDLVFCRSRTLRLLIHRLCFSVSRSRLARSCGRRLGCHRQYGNTRSRRFRNRLGGNAGSWEIIESADAGWLRGGIISAIPFAEICG